MKKWLALVVAASVVSVVLILAWPWKRNRPSSITPAAPVGADRSRPSEPCPGDTKTIVMKDHHMKGVIEQGSEFKVTLNWYACNPAKQGDLVYYRFSSSMDPVVRIVRAVAGDRFSLVADKEKKAWNIAINGQALKSDGKPYFFGVEAPPLLRLYEKSHGGVLEAKHAVIFSALPPGDLDSGSFGVVNSDDFIGKVEVDVSR